MSNKFGGEITYHGAGAINDYGDVVGGAYTPKGIMRPYFWSGYMKDIGTLPGDFSGCAYGLNNHDEIVGTSSGPDGEHAVLWDTGKLVRLPAPEGFQNAWPRAINENGEIVGCAYNPGNDEYSQSSVAVVWENKRIRVLSCPPGLHNGHAIAVNDARQIAGWAVDKAGHTRAVLWDGSRAVDLGEASHCLISMASGINNHGDVVGDGGNDAKSIRGIVWSVSGKIRKLETLKYANYSKATAINDGGTIVGNRKLDAGETSCFVQGLDGKMRDLLCLLPTSVYLPLHAYAVNKAGQILAWGDYRGISEQTYVLSPSSMPVPDYEDAPRLLPDGKDPVNWRLPVQPGAAASMTRDRGTIKVTVTKVDGTDWHVAAIERGVALVNGRRYVLTFRARADRMRTMHVTGVFELPDYHNIGLDKTIPLTTGWQTYSIQFTAKNVVPRETCVPNLLLGSSIGSVWVDAVELTQKNG